MSLGKLFLDQNILITNELKHYAPPDDKLLAIPYYINGADPFLSLFCQHTADKDPYKNNLLVGMNLLSLFQYLNRILSKVYATAQFIIENQNKPISSALNQQKIDSLVFIRSCILQEYQCSLREFVLTLKIAIDQLVFLLPPYLKNQHLCNNGIGDFLMHLDNQWEECRKFLTGLNIGANYLKHHRYQFEQPSQGLHLDPPSLLVIVENNDKKSCINFKTVFANHLNYFNDNKQILCLIGCDLLVDGFNKFYKKLNSQ